MPSTELTVEQVEASDDRFWSLLESVPFDRSAFQIERLVVNHLTPGRTLRSALLELSEKAQALHKASFDRQRTQVKLRQNRRKLVELRAKTMTDDDQDDAELIEIDVRELEFNIKVQNKLVNDALREVQTILNILAALPAYTRETFEAEEGEYWQRRFVFQARNEILERGTISVGTLESLQKTGTEPEFAMLTIKSQVESNLAALQKPASELVSSPKSNE
jgi:hypothetical protein